MTLTKVRIYLQMFQSVHNIFILVSNVFSTFFTSKSFKGFDWLRAVNTTEIPQSLALTIPYNYPTQPI